MGGTLAQGMYLEVKYFGATNRCGFRFGVRDESCMHKVESLTKF